MILAKQKLQQASPVSGKLWMIPASLSHNAGIITALIGSTTYSCTLSGLVANTRYQLYVVPGSTTLQFSTRENSLGPLGFTSWILIGSFYANGLSPVAFGGFVTIDGVPTSEDIAFDPNTNAQGLGTLTVLNMVYKRNGKYFEGNGSLFLGTRTGVEARIGMPFAIQIFASSNQLCGTVGYGASAAVTYGLIGGNTGHPYVIPTFNSSGGNGMNTGVLGTAIFTDGAKISPLWSIPIQAWSNTPLKDL